MSYQFFKPYASTLISRKLVFIEVGDGGKESGSFFIYTPEIAISGGDAVFTCWSVDPSTREAKKTFEIYIENISDMAVMNEQTFLSGTINNIMYTELPYNSRHSWTTPEPGEHAKVHIEEPFTTSLTELGLIIGHGDRAEIDELRRRRHTVHFLEERFKGESVPAVNKVHTVEPDTNLFVPAH